MNEVLNTEQTPHTLATYALALALFSLAASVTYFTWVIAGYRSEIPEILVGIEQVVAGVEPLVAEVENTRTVIEPILQEVAEVRKQIPSILEEVRLTRAQIPAILDEVKATRQQIPGIVDEVTAIRKELPRVSKTLENAGDTLDRVVKESAAIRKITPQVLAEVKATRESIPPMLDRADMLVANARSAGQEAGSGAVSGFLTGIVTAPFALVSDMGQSIFSMTASEAKDYSEKDMALLLATSEEVLALSKIGASKDWSNNESGYYGSITLISIDHSSQKHCRVINVKSWKKGEQKYSDNVTVCKNNQGDWKVQK